MSEPRSTIQQQVSGLGVIWFDRLHSDPRIDPEFRPWTCGLSPSALYSCSLKCRKLSKIKTPEVKWASIKRWVTTTPGGVDLPPGVYFSIKRHEAFSPVPEPHFKKTEYVLVMFPFGNVWSQVSPGVPITEEWLFSSHGEKMFLERLMQKDAASPLKDYFWRVHQYMVQNPDQIGIHLKRKHKAVTG